MVIRGRVKNGIVVLEGGTALPEGAQVSVLVHDAKSAADDAAGEKRVIEAEPAAAKGTYLTFGKYATGGKSTLDDFDDAEWHGDEGFDKSM